MGRIVSGNRVVDSAQVEEHARRAMRGLAALGVEEADSVALLLRNDIAFLEACVAIRGLGAYSVPLNWHAQPHEIRTILRDSGAKAVIAHADLAAAIGDLGVPSVAVPTPAEVAEAYALDAQDCLAPAGALAWESWLRALPAHTPVAPRTRGSIAYTSGSTGTPKGIQRGPCAGPAGEQAGLRTACASFGARAGVRSLICGPLYHSMQAANLQTAYSVFGDGGLVVIEPRFEPERLLANIEKHRITQILMVPVLFVRLLRLPQSVRRRYDLSSLEWVVHSAAPCAPQVKRAMIEWFGPVIREFYAQSETGAVTLIDSAEALRKPGSVGRALPGCTVKVLDDAGTELPPGEEGEIAAVNHAYPDFTYRNRPEARAAIERGGLIATGDIGYLDREGFLFLCGRKSDLVICGGVNIFPAQIEEALSACPGVADCAVFGIPDEEYGEVLAAHVQPLPGARLEESALRAQLRERLSGLQVPRIIRFEQALPRQDSGKIFKKRLRDPYWAAAGRRV
ncbi:MAG: AMP-binding protein [Burkholderiales bacterium]|nr:AMP-binding protein [Burkholderiales bacterium]